MKLKVCGLKHPENIKAVGGVQPDYLGFIFYKKSKRFIEQEIPKTVVGVKRVGVFVDASIDEVLNTILHNQLNAVQLHGSESPEFCKELKALCHSDPDIKLIELIKVFSVDDTFDFSVLKPFESYCDYYLFDTKGKLPGGNGYLFNWNVLNDYPSKKPFFLSGGIGFNQCETIEEFKKSPVSKYCYAIDVNSQFEIEPGLKDISLLKKFKNKLSF